MKKALVMFIAALLCLSSISSAAANSRWNSLETGTDGVIRASAVDSSGNLYIAGYFENAGGVSVNGLAKWDGSSWSNVSANTPPQGTIFAIAVDGNGNLYVGGWFTEIENDIAANNIAMWDGSSWSTLGSGVNDYVSALLVDSSGNLYAGGAFSEAGGQPANSVTKWNGSSWSALGTGITGDGWAVVDALAYDEGSNIIYAGGLFTHAGGIAANYIAKWDGASWSAIAGGMGATTHDNPRVFSLLVTSPGNVYAGGWFESAGGVSVNRIAKWDGTSWSRLGSGVSGSIPAVDFESRDGAVYALATDGQGNIYAGGNFLQAGNVQANHIAKWDGTSWSGLSSGMERNYSANDFFGVQTLSMSGNDLLAAGEFTSAGGISANNIAVWVSSVLSDREKADLLFNWLESMFPTIFAPPQQTTDLTGIFFRHYPAGIFLITFQGNLYYMAGTDLVDLGSVDYWIPFARGS